MKEQVFCTWKIAPDILVNLFPLTILSLSEFPFLLFFFYFKISHLVFEWTTVSEDDELIISLLLEKVEIACLSFRLYPNCCCGAIEEI